MKTLLVVIFFLLIFGIAGRMDQTDAERQHFHKQEVTK